MKKVCTSVFALLFLATVVSCDTMSAPNNYSNPQEPGDPTFRDNRSNPPEPGNSKMQDNRSNPPETGDSTMRSENGSNPPELAE